MRLSHLWQLATLRWRKFRPVRQGQAGYPQHIHSPGDSRIYMGRQRLVRTSSQAARLLNPSADLSSTLYIMRRSKGPEPFGTDGWEVFYACPGLTGSVDKDHRSTERGALRRSHLRM